MKTTHIILLVIVLAVILALFLVNMYWYLVIQIGKFVLGFLGFAILAAALYFVLKPKKTKTP